MCQCARAMHSEGDGWPTLCSNACSISRVGSISFSWLYCRCRFYLTTGCIRRNTVQCTASCLGTHLDLWSFPEGWDAQHELLLGCPSCCELQDLTWRWWPSLLLPQRWQRQREPDACLEPAIEVHSFPLGLEQKYWNCWHREWFDANVLVCLRIDVTKEYTDFVYGDRRGDGPPAIKLHFQLTQPLRWTLHSNTGMKSQVKMSHQATEWIKVQPRMKN